MGAAATVTDITQTRSRVGPSLAAVDLDGLTHIELGFGLVLAAAAGGLVLFLGLAERRRTFAIITALGGTTGQLRALVTAEAVVLTVGGLVVGAGGWVITQVLIAVLTGVFDPPPDAASVPWGYLAAVALITVLALAGATAAALRSARRSSLQVLREL